MHGNASDLTMAQHIPIRFGGGARKDQRTRDPDSLPSSDTYTRQGLLEDAPEPRPRPDAVPLEEVEPEGPTAEEAAELRQQLEGAQRQCHSVARDLENYKRHAKKEIASARSDAEAALLAELGDVVRSLELAMDTADQDADSVLQGVQMVARSLGRIYEAHGLERIPTVGHPFDPTLHEAVLVEEAPEEQKGTILRELSPGFTSGEKVVRPAKVSVAG